MEKNLRCTVCFWRGGWTDAQFAPRVSPSEITEAMATIQEAYEEQSVAAAAVGQLPPPPCPSCGHHTKVVPRRQSFHPAM